MEDACYICRRTQADLDRLNEEIRTRAYLSYFTNARGQLDEQRRRISFLQRLKDEESGDPHFRINAKQVFGDPMAYKKLMPWIETLMEIADPDRRGLDERTTMGELVEHLLQEERHIAPQMEEGLDKIRAGFATSGRSPLTLHPVSYSLPVAWSVGATAFSWKSGPTGEKEPLQTRPGDSKSTVEVPLHLCSLCLKIAGKG